uniref:DNA polymerase I n=1 Tax=candidate division WOR-3 bacterium TaxID=2052148 RepID=A0A7C4UFA6_UNCW3
MNKRLLLVDGSSLAYRSFYAFINNPLRNSKGFNTSGVYGFTRSIIKVLNEIKPDYAAISFDLPKPTLRHIEYKEYKGKRKKMPDELTLQMPYIKKITEALGIKILEKEGYEADDIIYTLAKIGSRENMDVIIFTFDKDIMQVIDNNIKILNMHSKGIEWIDENAVIEKFGVKPEHLPSLLSITGDSSDNIQGVKGFGMKNAMKLINKFGDIENIMNNIGNMEHGLREIFEENREMILKNYKLIKMEEIPIGIDIEDLRLSEKNVKELKKIFIELEFFSILKEMGLEEKIDIKTGRVEGEAISIFYFNDKFYLSDGNVVECIDKERAREKIENLSRIITDDIKNISLVLGFYPDKEITELGIIDYLIYPNEKSHNILKIVSKKEGKVLEENDESYKIAAIYGMKIEKEYLNELKEKGMMELYREIELPLTKILYKMEKTGIKFDIQFLEDLSKKICERLKDMEERIYKIAGEKFNIRSPKQLSYILFEKLKIKPVKKGKSHYSTDSETLQALSKDYEIAKILLDYRELEKIRSSYADALPKLVDQKTGRIHCTFNQTIAATGRLTASEPNLQTLPIRSDIGKEIRKALVAEDGYEIMSCDYSQIELRILAHFSGDKNLIKAFNEGRDIHKETAQVIFGHPEEITDEMRRVAKVVNFGLIYGMSAYGLSKELNITPEEASFFIDNYFRQFEGVGEWIRNILNFAMENGFVKTLFGRRRDIPELLTKGMEEYGKRIAINTPIQGTAADIIKLAMIRIDDFLKDYKTRMILQIHDELLFEIKKEEKEEVSSNVKRIMENVVKLNVPLIVDVNFGRNWAEAH